MNFLVKAINVHLSTSPRLFESNECVLERGIKEIEVEELHWIRRPAIGVSYSYER